MTVETISRLVAVEITPAWDAPILPWHPSNDEAAWRKAADALADVDLAKRTQAGRIPPCHVLTDVVVVVTDPHDGKAAPTASAPLVTLLLDAVVPHHRAQGRVYSRSWFTDPERSRRIHKVALHLTFEHDDARCARERAEWPS